MCIYTFTYLCYNKVIGGDYLFSIEYTKTATKFLEKHPDLKEFTNAALNTIAKDMTKLRQFDIKKLKGLADTYRLRKGNYRVIFQKNDQRLVIIVVNADNRGEVYK